MVERQTPNLRVGGSNPSWPANTKEDMQFLSEVKGELSKVVWPKLDEFVGSTAVVIFLVFAFAVYLGIIDFGLSQLANYIFKSYGLN